MVGHLQIRGTARASQIDAPLTTLAEASKLAEVIEEYGIAQISMNLTNIKVTPVHVAYEECFRRAEARGVRVTGSELVERIKSLAQEGNVRRLIIRKPSGEALLEIPLTAGVVAGGGLILLAPVLAALGALAALLAEVKVEIVRVDDDND